MTEVYGFILFMLTLCTLIAVSCCVKANTYFILTGSMNKPCNGIIPNMTRKVFFIIRAVMSFFIAELIDAWRTISRANRNTSKFILEWFEQLLAQLCTCVDGFFRMIGEVGYTGPIGDFAIQKVTHKKGLGEFDASSVFEFGDG